MQAEQRPRLWNPCRGYACKTVSDFYITEPNSSISGCIGRLMNPARFGYYLLASVLDNSKIKLQLLNHISLLEMWTRLLTHEIHGQHSPMFHLYLFDPGSCPLTLDIVSSLVSLLPILRLSSQTTIRTKILTLWKFPIINSTSSAAGKGLQRCLSLLFASHGVSSPSALYVKLTKLHVQPYAGELSTSKHL